MSHHVPTNSQARPAPTPAGLVNDLHRFDTLNHEWHQIVPASGGGPGSRAQAAEPGAPVPTRAVGAYV